MTVIDFVLLTSHVFLMLDLTFDWDSFGGCARPVHYWLFASYALMLISRVVLFAGTHLNGGGSGHFLLNARQKDSTSKFVFGLMWGILLPISTVWHVIGTVWLWDVRSHSPGCMTATSNHFWVMITWQVLGYLWFIVHCRIGFVAWLLERRVRAVEDDLRQVSDDDMLSRWGHTAEHVQDYTALRGQKQSAGLRPAEIHALRCDEFSGDSTECSICLASVDVGNHVRELTCGHVFHRSCIDLWLLRSSACPLCKCCQKTWSGGHGCESNLVASLTDTTSAVIRFRFGAASAV